MSRRVRPRPEDGAPADGAHLPPIAPPPIGSIVLAPWTRAAADRFDRRRLLMVSQLDAAVVGGLLALLTVAGPDPDADQNSGGGNADAR